MKNKKVICHIMALVTVIVWGTTLVSTKILLEAGLTPADIMFYRFLIAYIGLRLIPHKGSPPIHLKDERRFALAGITGGSFYFITENTALQYTFASNVGLILVTAPIITIFLTKIVLNNFRIKSTLIWGSLLALAGVAMVIYNGNIVLKLNPAGDLLTLLSAISWAVYSVTLKFLDKKYDTVLITRKVFFYGLLTLLPVFLFTPLTVNPVILK